jgi:hypothetical protein
MDKTRIAKGHLNYNLKERDLWDDPKQATLARNWKTSRGKEIAGKKIKSEDSGKMKEIQDFFSNDS